MILESPAQSRFSTGAGPFAAAPLSKIMPQPPIPPAALVLFGVSLVHLTAAP